MKTSNAAHTMYYEKCNVATSSMYEDMYTLYRQFVTNNRFSKIVRIYI